MNLRNRKKEKKKLYILLLLLLTMTIGIGYAILSETLKINSTIEYNTMKWDVGFSTASDGGGTVSSNPVISTDKKNITISCNLGTSTASETCIAKATIKNGSTYDIKLDSNPSISYEATYVKSVAVEWTDTSNSVRANDSINFGESREVNITITTNELTAETLPDDSLSIPVTITMEWVEKNSLDNSLPIILANEDFIVGCYYNNGTLKTENVFAKIRTTEKFITPEKIRVVVEDSANDVSASPYTVIYSAYDSSGNILNPGDSTNARFSLENGTIDLDLPTLYPEASQFRVDIMIHDTTFYDIPATATFTVYSLE